MFNAVESLDHSRLYASNANLSFVVTVGHGLCAPTVELDGHNDHRVVMALAVLCARTGGTITGAEAVNKSFPDFFERLKDLGVKMEIR